MRDSRDTRPAQVTAAASGQLNTTDAAMRGAAGFGAQIAGETYNSLKESAKLTDDDKKQIEAVQAAESVYREDEIKELSSGLDRLTGKQANRAKYAKEIAARNNVSRFATEYIETLGDKADLEASEFAEIATADYKASAASEYGKDTEGYKLAVDEFNRTLPSLSRLQAQHYASAQQARVVEGNVKQYEYEWNGTLQVLNGVAAQSDKDAAAVMQRTFFDDGYSIGNISVDATRNQKALAIRRSLNVDNTSMYTAAKDAGFMSKLDPKVAAVLDKEMEAASGRRKATISLQVDTRINNALDAKSLADTGTALNELLTARKELNQWKDSGFGTQSELQHYENVRRELIRAEAEVIPKSTKQDRDYARTVQLLESKGDAVKYGGYKPTDAEAATTVQLDTTITASKMMGRQLTDEEANRVALTNPQLFEYSMKSAEFFKKPAEQMVTTVQTLLRNLPSETLETGELSDDTQQMMNTLTAYATSEPAKFEAYFGEDASEQVELYKINGGKSGQAYTEAVNEYYKNKKIPVTSEMLGLKGGKTITEYVVEKTGLQGANAMSAEYIKQKFVSGVHMTGSVEGGIAYAKKFVDNIDDEFKGVVIQDGKVYANEVLGGRSVGEAIGFLETQTDTNGDTYFTHLLRNNLPLGSSVQKLDDLNDMTIRTDAITGRLMISSSDLLSPIILDESSVKDMLNEADKQRELYEGFINTLATRERFSNMYNSGQYNRQQHAKSFSYVTEDPNNNESTRRRTSEWDEYRRQYGEREADKVLQDVGITPPADTITDIVIPVTDLVDYNVAATTQYPELKAALAGEGSGIDKSLLYDESVWGGDDASAKLYRLSDTVYNAIEQGYSEEQIKAALGSQAEYSDDLYKRVADEYAIVNSEPYAAKSGIDLSGRKVLNERDRYAANEAVLRKYSIGADEQTDLVQVSGEAIEILRHEGMVPTVYNDTAGNPTWGVGFKLTSAQLDTNKWKAGIRFSKDSMLKEFKSHLAVAKEAAITYLSRSGVKDPSDEMVNIVTNMAYNHGASGLDEYIGMAAALQSGNASRVLTEMRNSKWWKSYAGKQMDRANELVYRMQTELVRQGDWIWEN